MSATGREVILGVGAGIAAYKSCELLRRLQDRGYAVSVVPTPSSLNFVGKATWQALSGRPVETQVWENTESVSHISIAQRSEAILIAPATADLIARIAFGRADDLLTNLLLASQVPVLIVPAMHPAMWQHPATMANVITLRNRGYIVMEPETGRLTGVDSGVGRFPETSRIIEAFDSITGNLRDFVGQRVLITGGGTREPIDPVRFIGNRSSGKQAIAIAVAAALRGAEVHLIAANIDDSLLKSLNGIELTRVESAKEMQRVLLQEFESCDLLVMCAAVADVRPVNPSQEKLKKSMLNSIAVESNPDLLAQLGKAKTRQIMVGFAAETTNLIESARAKLIGKNLDLIYVNDVSSGAVFGEDTTQGNILSNTGTEITIKEQSKYSLANILLDNAILQLG